MVIIYLDMSVISSNVFLVNVQLSMEETYADVAPVRLDAQSTSAFV